MRGFKFPLTIKNNSFEETSQIDSNSDSGIEGRIKMLLKTGKSSRPFSGDYGIGLERVFSLLGGETISFKQGIIDAVNTFIPEISLSLSNIEIDIKNEGILNIAINYPDRNLSLVVDFQLF